MDTPQNYRRRKRQQTLVTFISAGVEVVTYPDPDVGNFVSVIHGGELDGVQFATSDQDRTHEHAVSLARGEG